MSKLALAKKSVYAQMEKRNWADRNVKQIVIGTAVWYGVQPGRLAYHLRNEGSRPSCFRKHVASTM